MSTWYILGIQFISISKTLNFMVILWGKYQYCYFPYFTDEETETERLIDLPEVTTASEGRNRGKLGCLGVYLAQTYIPLFFCVCDKNTTWDLLGLRVQYSFINFTHSVVWEISRSYLSCLTETLYLLNGNSPFPSPPASGNLESALCFSGLTTLDASCKRNGTVFVLLWLTYFT